MELNVSDSEDERAACAENEQGFKGIRCLLLSIVPF